MRQVKTTMSSEDIKPKIEAAPSISLGAPFQEEDIKPKLERLRSPSLRPRSRNPSVESTMSWGSNIANADCQCVAHKGDEVEVANWLLSTNEKDWAAPDPSAPQGPPSLPPFSYYQVPAAFVMQFWFAILAYFNLIPNHPVYTRPVITPPQQRPFPIKRVNYHASPHLTRFDVRADGSRMLYDGSEAYHLVDDMEYVIFGNPLQNLQDVRIPMTMDCSAENLDTHLPSLVRIYLVQHTQLEKFQNDCLARRLYLTDFRIPRDRYDNVAVFRQGFVTKPSADHWLLVGSSPVGLGQLWVRALPWPRSNFSIVADYLDAMLLNLYHYMAYYIPRFIRRVI